MPSWLFHNNGDGTFTDVSQATGMADNPGRAWGVVAADINNDGWMDLFVANEQSRISYSSNRAGKRIGGDLLYFRCGVSETAVRPVRAWAWTLRISNQDGWADLFVTNMNHECIPSIATSTMKRSRTAQDPRASRRHAVDERLGPQICRLRQRWKS